MALTAGVIDPNPVYRRGLLDVLQDHGLDALEIDDALMPPGTRADVLLVGASGPSGRDLIRRAQALYPGTPIVAIVPSSGTGGRRDVAVLTDGASASVPVDAPRSVIAAAVRAATEDWSVIALRTDDIRSLRELFVHLLTEEPTDLADDEILLLRRVFEGATRQVMADEFHYASRTVDRRLEHIYRKLSASNRTDAVLRALLWGYLTSPECLMDDDHHSSDIG